MFKTFGKHLALAFLFFILTLSQQYLFYFIKSIPIQLFASGKYLAIFAFFLVATFIRPLPLRYFWLAFIIIINAFQMGHLSYFGTQILPNEIYLFLSQFNEIHGTLMVEYHHVVIPLLFTLIPALVGYLAVKKTPGLYGSKVIGVLFCLYFIYNPIRTYVTGNTWGRQPSTRELSGMNVYLSFSYFMGKILPHKMFQGSAKNTVNNTSMHLKIENGNKLEWDKIVFILGESLTPHHMSLFGYERSTTPFLMNQMDAPDFFSTIGLSGGVSTDIAVAFLLNMGFGEAGSYKAAKGDQCLFKLAKNKGMGTHFISVQSQEQLRYISPFLCASSLDDLRTLEDISPQTTDDQAASDSLLLPELEKLLSFEASQFILLHQRGSHGPWEKRSLPGRRKYPHDDKINHYDNSVVEFDLFFKELDKLIKKSGKKVLVVYVSDHGEGLGQNGVWGHGMLNRSSFEVPVIVISYLSELPPKTRLLPRNLTHYNLSLYLAEQLGYKLNQDSTKLVNDYVIFGNDIDGFAGKAEILFKSDNTYDLKVIQ